MRPFLSTTPPALLSSHKCVCSMRMRQRNLFAHCLTDIPDSKIKIASGAESQRGPVRLHRRAECQTRATTSARHATGCKHETPAHQCSCQRCYYLVRQPLRISESSASSTNLRYGPKNNTTWILNYSLQQQAQKPKQIRYNPCTICRRCCTQQEIQEKIRS